MEKVQVGRRSSVERGSEGNGSKRGKSGKIVSVKSETAEYFVAV